MAGRIWCNLLNETRIVKGALQLNRENLSNVSTAMDFSFLIIKLFLFTVALRCNIRVDFQKLY